MWPSALKASMTNMRTARPEIPGRGASAGGFIGPFRISALTAWEALHERGIEVDIRFSLNRG